MKMKITTPNLETVNTESLNLLELRAYMKYREGGKTREQALQIIINTTEGDFSQLSDELRERAEQDPSWR